MFTPSSCTRNVEWPTQVTVGCVPLALRAAPSFGRTAAGSPRGGSGQAPGDEARCPITEAIAIPVVQVPETSAEMVARLRLDPGGLDVDGRPGESASRHQRDQRRASGDSKHASGPPADDLGPRWRRPNRFSVPRVAGRDAGQPDRDSVARSDVRTVVPGGGGAERTVHGERLERDRLRHVRCLMVRRAAPLHRRRAATSGARFRRGRLRAASALDYVKPLHGKRYDRRGRPAWRSIVARHGETRSSTRPWFQMVRLHTPRSGATACIADFVQHARPGDPAGLDRASSNGSRQPLSSSASPCRARDTLSDSSARWSPPSRPADNFRPSRPRHRPCSVSGQDGCPSSGKSQRGDGLCRVPTPSNS